MRFQQGLFTMANCSSSSWLFVILLTLLWFGQAIAAGCQQSDQEAPPRQPLRRMPITLKNREGRPVHAYLSINPAALTVKHRSRRSATGTLCSMHHLSSPKDNFVLQNFKGNRLQILEPDSLRLNYCSGTCPVGLRSSDITYNVIFLDMVRVMPNFNHIPAPCCVPSKFRRSSIIVQREDGYIEHLTLDNMTVRECGCR